MNAVYQGVKDIVRKERNVTVTQPKKNKCPRCKSKMLYEDEDGDIACVCCGWRSTK